MQQAEIGVTYTQEGVRQDAHKFTAELGGGCQYKYAVAYLGGGCFGYSLQPRGGWTRYCFT